MRGFTYQHAMLPTLISPPTAQSRGSASIVGSTEPKLVGCWWPPGTKEDDPNPWEVLDPAHDKFQVHGAIPYGNRAYVSCTDAGVAILDISDLSAPKLISRINWCPPYGGYAHTALPLRRGPQRFAVSPGDASATATSIGHRYQSETSTCDDQQFPRAKPPENSPWKAFTIVGPFRP
jgi:hypothetical protein